MPFEILILFEFFSLVTEFSYNIVKVFNINKIYIANARIFVLYKYGIYYFKEFGIIGFVDTIDIDPDIVKIIISRLSTSKLNFGEF